MDAPVFLHPITSNAYTPHHPAPPRYIKVRTHNKRIADFNRVFLAQELRGRKPDAGGATTPRLSAPDGAHPARTPVRSSAIWSLEFSVDGRFLAAGGQDRVVRVWVVIATAEEREAHESEEATTAVDAAGQTMRLHAPVFRTKPVREYEGHTLDVLDLSWSKVRRASLSKETTPPPPPPPLPNQTDTDRHSSSPAPPPPEQFSAVVVDGQDGAAVAYQSPGMPLLLQA